MQEVSEPSEKWWKISKVMISRKVESILWYVFFNLGQIRNIYTLVWFLESWKASYFDNITWDTLRQGVVINLGKEMGQLGTCTYCRFVRKIVVPVLDLEYTFVNDGMVKICENVGLLIVTHNEIEQLWLHQSIYIVWRRLAQHDSKNVHGLQFSPAARCLG